MKVPVPIDKVPKIREANLDVPVPAELLINIAAEGSPINIAWKRRTTF